MTGGKSEFPVWVSGSRRDLGDSGKYESMETFTKRETDVSERDGVEGIEEKKFR